MKVRTALKGLQGEDLGTVEFNAHEPAGIMHPSMTQLTEHSLSQTLLTVYQSFFFNNAYLLDMYPSRFSGIPYK